MSSKTPAGVSFRNHLKGFNTIASNLYFPSVLFEHIPHDATNTWTVIDNQ